jgi:hypothetical protein
VLILSSWTLFLFYVLNLQVYLIHRVKILYSNPFPYKNGNPQSQQYTVQYICILYKWLLHEIKKELGTPQTLLHEDFTGFTSKFMVECDNQEPICNVVAEACVYCYTPPPPPILLYIILVTSSSVEGSKHKKLDLRFSWQWVLKRMVFCDMTTCSLVTDKGIFQGPDSSMSHVEEWDFSTKCWKQQVSAKSWYLSTKIHDTRSQRNTIITKYLSNQWAKFLSFQWR